MFSLLSISTFAADFRTQDNTDYAVVLNDGLTNNQIKICVNEICKLSKEYGNGTCSYMSTIGVTMANLTFSAAEQVSKMKCVLSVEITQEMEHLPRVGRSN